MKVALAQIDIRAGDPEANVSKMLQYIKEAKADNVDVIAFPEMAVGGYLIGDKWLEDDYCRYLMSFNDRIRMASEDITVIYGNVYLLEGLEDKYPRIKFINNDGRKIRFNAAYIYQNQQAVINRSPYPTLIPDGIQIKILLPNYRYFDDKRYFMSFVDYCKNVLDTNNAQIYPFVINANNKSYRIGLEICEDMWSSDYSVNPTEYFQKTDLIINISSSPWTYGKNKTRDKIVKNIVNWKETYLETNIDVSGNIYEGKECKTYPPFAYVNCVGAQNNGKNILGFDGASTVYGQDGKPKILANADFKEELLIFEHDKIPKKTAIRKKEQKIPRKYQVIIRGIQHMTDVTGIGKYVIGLSGGIDSAVVATLLADALGKENVIAVNMPSKYNSQKTKDAAKSIAKRLGIKYVVIPIGSVNSYNQRVLEVARTNLGYTKEGEYKLKDLTQENIQAKIRGAGILSNLAGELGCFFSCNGNKVEIALGYATLYGDWGGSVAPIGDLTKAEVYKMAKYLNKIHRKNPIPGNLLPNSNYEFKGNKIAPSAELKDDQVDPIKVGYHCALIEKLLDYKKFSPEQIMQWYVDRQLPKNLGITSELFYERYGMDNIKDFVEDLKWVCQKMKSNVFKRVQSPPIIITSKTAFGYDLRESILPSDVADLDDETINKIMLFKVLDIKKENNNVKSKMS